MKAETKELAFNLIEAVPDPVVLTGPDGRIEFVNAQAELLFGYPRSELLGHAVEILMPERHRADHVGQRDMFVARGLIRHMGADLKISGRRKDGSEFPADISLAPLRTDEGVLLIAAIRDVSEAVHERNGLEELHQVAVSSAGMLDPSMLGHLVVEAARRLLRSDDSTLLWWDPASESLRVLADTYWRPFPRSVRVGEGAAGIAFERREQVVVEDYPNWEHAVPGSLSRGLKSAAAIPLLARDHPVGALTVAFNSPRRLSKVELRLLSLLGAQVAPVLESARLHDELRHMASELQLASEAKSRFLASMSHELRTPLNAIIGFAELILDDAGNKFDPARRQRFMEQIQTSGRHLLGLINDILDLSKVEAGQMTLKLQDTSVAEVVTEVLDSMEPIAAKKGIRIENDVETAGYVRADKGKLRQMLLNLVSNAVKFTGEGGVIAIAARRVADHVEISVTDTGIGIAASDLDRLFKEFQQLDTVAAGRQEGTGLGLALTKRLTELHGGEIRVSSELGRGSVFTLVLPALSSAGRPDPTESETARRIDEARPLVLVVDDNEHAADLLVHLLKRGGFRTQIAASGSEALAKARELQPVAITLDILLPGIDGWEVLIELKRDEATRDIPVVVVSVVDRPELGRALGALDYFVKPVDGKALLARLGKYNFTSGVDNGEVRILVVDDEPANIEWLEGVLRPAGFSVISAGGGADGIKLARESHPQMVLLDLMMPEVSGFDVVEALQSDEATRSIPIMVLTAKDLTEVDKSQLNGSVSAILTRGSTGAPDLLVWLDRLMAAQRRAN